MKCPQCRSIRVHDSEFSLTDRRHFHCLNCGYFFSKPLTESREYKKVKEAMNIRIIEFYPIEDKKDNVDFEGNLNVLLVDIDVILRGVHVQKKGEKWFFTMPYLSCRTVDTYDKVRVPIFSFKKNAMTEALKQIIIDEGKEYILKNRLKKGSLVST